MKAVDIMLQRGTIHFVRIKHYRYIRIRVSAAWDEYILVDRLLAVYGGCISRGRYAHLWVASHVGDIRLVALDVLEHVSTGRLTRIMDMLMWYCNTTHGSRSKAASHIFETFGVSSIRLHELE